MTVTFIRDDGLLRWGERTAELTPQQAAILGTLRRYWPHMVPMERLATALWPAQFPEDPGRHVRVQICRLRKRLAAAGIPVEIRSRPYYGYRIDGEIEVT